MKADRKRVFSRLSAALLAVSLLLLAAAFGLRVPTDTRRVALRTERILESRLATLDGYARKALEGDPHEWLEFRSLPSDMAIYRYVGDSLQSWANCFSTSNDQLYTGTAFQVLGNSRSGMRSPLGDVTDSLGFFNIGPKWYLARSVSAGDVRVISGMEVMNTLDSRSYGGINPRLRVPENFSIHELSTSGGSAVSIGGRPLFKVIYDSLSSAPQAAMPTLWAALLFLLVAALLFLYSAPTVKNLILEVAAVLAVLLVFYLNGSRVSTNSGLFSPLLYADGKLFYALGAMVLLILMAAIPVWSVFIARGDLHRVLDDKPGRWLRGLLLVLLACGVGVFSYIAIKSISLNSNINLEIYKIKQFTWLSALVYLLLLILLSCIPVILHLLQPIVRSVTGFRGDLLSLPGRIILSVAVAAYLVAVTAYLGFQKEQASLEVWANRLALSRDISLEMQLRSVEDRMASDPVIASLALLDNAGASIRNRIIETYLPRVAQEYDLLVSVGSQIDLNLPAGGEYISPGTRFIYKETRDGLAAYYALFSYNIRDYGFINLMLQVEQKGDWRYRGYSSILGEAPPGEVLIPSSYAFARYQGRDIITLRGNFAYPVRMDDELASKVYEKDGSHMKRGGYTHFVYVVADNESVIVSRRTISAVYYGISVIFLGLIAFLALSVTRARRKDGELFDRNYFSTRLSWVIMVSLTLALVSMAAVSVFFVYDRNEENRNTLMTEKINSIAASISASISGATSSADLRRNEVLRLIEDVGNNTNSDVTLYDDKGMVMMSTAPTVFDRMMMDARIDGEAYRNIMLVSRRYHIQREQVGGRSFYSMYAPLVGDDGRIIAIICAPYTDDNYDFETNAANHSIMILSVFIFLLLVASFMTRRVLERMFKPLVEIGQKMEDANLDSLEYIQYDKQDEITSLVNAYNRMVTDLSESSRQLAEAERDKAWSGMARQVAHEIKNPLTPMKLQIQRLARLKAKGDPSWQDKFDEVSKMLLDHIDILTDTANEFSTFAKLYTEEPSLINLDKVLQEEISMFAGRDDIRFDYIGLEGALVTGPKPQLTRVFVNLINNAVQALEDTENARVLVSLRNSVKDGFYDIVFEDNGPGVAPENVDKLFTPNFTTKTSGSGLGLAISRSILQKCDATIRYSKSFALGGACFTILYPKNTSAAPEQGR